MHVLRARAWLEDLALTDQLTDELGRKTVGRVEVWENERLDPGVASKKEAPGREGWSSKHLRAGERKPWIKVRGEGALWLPEEGESSAMQRDGQGGSASTDGSEYRGREGDKDKEGKDREGQKEMGLALNAGWSWIPGEEWRVDVGGLWALSTPGTGDSASRGGSGGGARSDEDGWVYTDDSWQNPSRRANTDASPDPGGTGLGIGAALGGQGKGQGQGQGKDGMPQLALRRVTRRRMWWRRVYYEADPEGADKAGLGRRPA